MSVSKVILHTQPIETSGNDLVLAYHLQQTTQVFDLLQVAK